MTLLGVALGVVAVLLSLPVAILFVEVLCAVTAIKSDGSICRLRPPGIRVAVLIPAHDEEDGIGETVSVIGKYLGASDRMIVVADNCSDATVERARAAGANVIERFDFERRGKGYALDFGVHKLNDDPPDIVLIIDADCRVDPETIELLVARCNASRSAVQALYLVNLPRNAEPKHRIAGFAWAIKNHLRPAGLASLGLPCQLMGTGIAIPWEAIQRIDLATSNIVEDVQMGLDLAAAGYAPVYCPEARIESDFPATERGIAVQRQRWEMGSLNMGMKIAPVMFVRGLMDLNAPLMAMAADLMVPPLMVLLTALMLGLTLTFILAVFAGFVFPLVMFGVSLSILMLTLAMAWRHIGSANLRLRDVLALPGVFIRKFGFYLAMWRGRRAGWIRTDRK